MITGKGPGLCITSSHLGGSTMFEGCWSTSVRDQLLYMDGVMSSGLLRARWPQRDVPKAAQPPGPAQAKPCTKALFLKPGTLQLAGAAGSHPTEVVWAQGPGVNTDSPEPGGCHAAPCAHPALHPVCTQPRGSSISQQIPPLAKVCLTLSPVPPQGCQTEPVSGSTPALWPRPGPCTVPCSWLVSRLCPRAPVPALAHPGTAGLCTGTTRLCTSPMPGPLWGTPPGTAPVGPVTPLCPQAR